MRPDWPAFERGLAERLATLPDREFFCLAVDESKRPDFDGNWLYVQFLAHDRRLIRCEVVSNHYLPPARRHRLPDLVAMHADGWNLPEDERRRDDPDAPNIWVTVLRDDASRAAAMVAGVLRGVWRVADPSGIVGPWRPPTPRAEIEGPDERTIDPLG